ncbi:MAG: four helix bundle protein [Desulfobacterales bacterium]|nr:four helix bundle protein [Desulfobacterales bacterium]
MEKGGFRELRVWQKGVELAVKIYKITGSGSFSKDYDLKGQIRKAAVSIPSNIAEGDELGSNKQANRHFYIAKGSSAEVFTQALVAYRVGHISEDVFANVEMDCGEISRMLANLIKARSTSP